MIVVGVVVVVVGSSGSTIGRRKDAGDGGEGVRGNRRDIREGGRRTVRVHKIDPCGGARRRRREHGTDDRREASTGGEAGARREASAEGSGIEAGKRLVIVAVWLGTSEHGGGQGSRPEGVGEICGGESPCVR